MAGVGGQEVGRISIRVVPNLDGFHSKIKAAIAAAEKLKVDIDVKAKTAGLKQKIENAAKGAKTTLDVDADGTQVRRTVRKATSKLPDAEVKVKADRRPLDRFMNRMLADLNSSMAKIERRFPLTAGGEAMRREYERIEQGIKSLAQDKISPDLVIAAGQRRMILREVQEIRRQAEAKPIELKVDLEGTHRLRQQLAKRRREEENRLHRERLSHWQDELRHMKMREDETRKFLENYRREWAARGWNLFPVELELDREATHRLQQKVAKLKPKVEVDLDVDQSRLGRLSRAFSRIQMPNFGTGINMAGYGVIFGLITFLAGPLMGVLTSALLTLPGLISAIATPIGAVLAGLDGFKKAAKQLEAPLNRLKQTMSATAETVFTPILRQLTPLFDSVQATLPRVTQGLGDMAQSVVDVLTGERGMRQIEDTITNIGEAMTDAAPGISDFTSGMVTLANELSKKFPDMAEWFNGAGKSFNDMITRMSEDGTLSSTFDGLGRTLRTLLEALGDLGKEGLEFMSNPDNLDGFINSLKQLGELLEMIMQLSEKLNQLLGLFSWGAPDPDELEGGLEDRLKKKLGDYEGTIEGPKLKPDKDFEERIRQRLEDGPFGEKKLFRNLKEQATRVVGDVTLKFGELIPSLGNIWNTIAGAARGALNGITAVVSTVVSSVVQFFTNIPSQLAGVWSSITNAASTAFQSVVTAASTIVGTVVSTFTSMVSQIVAEMARGGAQIVAEVSTWPGKILGALGDLAGQLFQKGQEAVQGFINGLQSIPVVGPAIKLGTSVIGGAADALQIKSPSKKMAEIGRWAAEGLGLGIEDGSQPVIDRARSLAEEIAKAMEEGLSGFEAESVNDKLDRMLDEIDLRRKELKVQYNDAEGDDARRDALRDQRKQLQTVRDQLSLQKEQLGFADKYGDSVKSTNDYLGDALTSLIDMGAGFAQAQAGGLREGLNMGGGVITAAAEQGLGWATQALGQLVSNGLSGGTTIQVNSVDEAVAAHDRVSARKALQFNRRR